MNKFNIYFVIAMLWQILVPIAGSATAQASNFVPQEVAEQTTPIFSEWMADNIPANLATHKAAPVAAVESVPFTKLFLHDSPL